MRVVFDVPTVFFVVVGPRPFVSTTAGDEEDDKEDEEEDDCRLGGFFVHALN